LKRISSSGRKTGRGATDIDSYLAALPSGTRSGLQKVRKAIHAAAPRAEEGFGYGMPAFSLGGRPLVYFAAAKHHSSLYISPAVIRAHAAGLKDYETSKGTIRFPQEAPPPATLVAKLVKARIAMLQRRRP